MVQKVIGIARNGLVVSYFKDGQMAIGTYKASLSRKDVAELIEAAKWHQCRLDLSGKSLPDNYSGLKFEWVLMKNINTDKSTVFDRCTFNGVDLSYAWLFGNSFRGAVFTDVSFDSANLSHSDFSGAQLHRVSFDETNMFRVKCDRYTGFEHCNINRAVHLDLVDF